MAGRRQRGYLPPVGRSRDFIGWAVFWLACAWTHFRATEPAAEDPRNDEGSLESPKRRAGFTEIAIEDTGEKYLAAYRKVLALSEHGALPPLGVHILLGPNAQEKTRNAARNIEEGRTHPVQVICRRRT